MAPRYEIANKTILDETMDSLAREYSGLKLDDQRRDKIIKQLPKLSLLATQFVNTEIQ